LVELPDPSSLGACYARQLTVRIFQLTDLHLLANPDGTFHKVPPLRTLQEVLDSFRSDVDEHDLIVVSGDIAQDESRGAYELLRSALGPLVSRCRIIPGNHDDRALIGEVFADIVDASIDWLTFHEVLGRWLIVGVDTQAPGSAHGVIDARQLRLLDQRLQEHPERPTAVFLHHNPLPVGSRWIDRLGLREGKEAFYTWVQGRPQIRFVCHGHTHQDFTGAIGQVRVYGTPSTSAQFKPRSTLPLIDRNVAPAYREIRLLEDTYTTRVVRMPAGRYVPARLAV
jgi:3',5'-cyclic-AMP phosphodiesterase